MDILTLRYQQLLKAYKALEKIFAKMQQLSITSSQIEKEAYRDASIKRFEFCYELTWKYLKRYLETKFGIIERSPKTVVQECFKQKILSMNDTELFQKIIDDRNATSHIYDEKKASQISTRIPSYLKLFLKLSKQISP